jgi:hypothetical protein
MYSFFFILKDFDLSYLYSLSSKYFYEFYSKNMRGHLFAGFLALGGFLLSLKTFIIVNMKENLFSSEDYIKRWEKAVKTYPELKLHAPLEQLSHILYYAIFTCLLAAISQMTIGFITHDYSALICIYLCLVSSFLLIKSLYIIKNNLDTWFEYLE